MRIGRVIGDADLLANAKGGNDFILSGFSGKDIIQKLGFVIIVSNPIDRIVIGDHQANNAMLPNTAKAPKNTTIVRIAAMLRGRAI